jgi:hypothetical protein
MARKDRILLTFGTKSRANSSRECYGEFGPGAPESAREWHALPFSLLVNAHLQCLLIIAGLLTPLDVLVLPHQELARKLHVVDARHIIDAISRAIAPQPVIIDNSFKSTAESISTGDDAFDALLGGGITTGAIWEVVGER